MNRKIVLSKRASSKLEKLLDYLENEWSVRVKKSFVKKLDKSLHVISKNPESFQKSNIINELHRCVVTKQTTIYYKFDNKEIKIVTFFDTRQNPKKLIKDTKIK